MITKSVDENSISFIPEESDDLLTLRRIIKKGDKIVGDTKRVIKQDKDYSRPDKGERIKIRISLDVDKVSLDNVLDRLRVQGTIAESSRVGRLLGNIMLLFQPFASTQCHLRLDSAPTRKLLPW